MTVLFPHSQDVVYPETDGLPLSDNTQQFRLIVTTQGGLDALFRRENVFVAGNLLWFPVEGSTEGKAPDVMVVFGQEKGDRTSYKQWEEGNLGPQVVFEFVSKTNSVQEVEVEKRDFYQQHGVEEYYIHDPDKGTLKGWMRQGSQFQPIREMQGWTSPRLGIRFELIGKEMQLYYPNGERFESYPELMARSQQERQRAELAESRAELAESRAELAESQLAQERQRAERLAEQLRALGIDPNRLN